MFLYAEDVWLSFVSPLTSCLTLDPETTSFEQRIKQRLTEWRDWEVRIPFLVRWASVFVLSHIFPELTFHIPVWDEQLLNVYAVKCERNIWHSTFDTICLKWLRRVSGGITFLSNLAFQYYVNFCLCDLNKCLAQHSCPAFISGATPTVCSRHLSQMREFSLSVEPVGVCSYYIFILFLWLYFRRRKVGDGYHSLC